MDGSYLMGHGSHIRWVNGSWVNSNDPLPALVPSNTVLDRQGRAACAEKYSRDGSELEVKRNFKCVSLHLRHITGLSIGVR